MKLDKTLILFALMITFQPAAFAQISEAAEQKIDSIIKSLTIEEKAGQLNLIPIDAEPTKVHLELIKAGKVGSILKSNGVDQNKELQKLAVEASKSGIPILFQEDVIHGYRTIAPIPLAEAASWDLEAIRNSAAVAAREAASAGIHLTYAPMVDIGRDPRWGRVLEAAGEDAYLGSEVAAARVKGFQESGEENENILACVKHFAGYGASLAGRDYNIQDFSERELRELYLPPFQAAIDAGVSSVMAAYSAFDGIPVSASEFLLKDVLRDEMGFKGLVMTDWRNVTNLLNFGLTDNNKEAVEIAMNAGNDMDMSSEQYIQHIPSLVKEGKLSEAQVDIAVKRVLVLKEMAGLLDDPYASFDKKREKEELLSKKNYKETKDIALKSMVLLKNENKLLPLKEKKPTIAVIGPLSKSQKDLLGWWACKGQPEEAISIFDGIKNEFGAEAEILYAQGCRIDSFNIAGEELIPEAVNTAKKADVVVMVLGERYWMSGEGGGTASIRLPSLQEKLIKKVAETGKPIVSIIVSGKPYILTEIEKYSDAMIQAWMPGTTGGEAVADILAGKFNPSGKLPITFPYHEGQIPIFYNYRRSSHHFTPGITDNRYSATYRDMQNEPLYPFGYGLSYTSFSYSEVKLNKNNMDINGSIKAWVEVTNTGDVAGREVVQLYIGDKLCSVSRPNKELKGFQVLELQPGESKKAEFTITADMLSFIGRDHKRTVEPGEFEVFIVDKSSGENRQSFMLK